MPCGVSIAPWMKIRAMVQAAMPGNDAVGGARSRTGLSFAERGRSDPEAGSRGSGLGDVFERGRVY